MTVIRTAAGEERHTAWPYVRWPAGAGPALVLYLLIRGGLLNFGAVVGIFSDHMTGALQRVMDTLSASTNWASARALGLVAGIGYGAIHPQAGPGPGPGSSGVSSTDSPGGLWPSRP